MNETSHCFPIINTDEIPEPKDRGDACHLFRPIYRTPSHKRSSGPTNACDDHDGSKALEEIREKNFKKGYEAGCRDACNLAHQELAPTLNAFWEVLGSYSTCFTKVTDNYSNYILSLALAIAKKILNNHLELDSDRLGSISREFESLLKQTFQLGIEFNREDLQSLSERLDCDHPDWKHSAAINIIGKNDIRKGRLQTKTSNQNVDGLKSKLLQHIDDVLSNL
ncbi:MAG: FliH/SctL family protein [Desulfobacteraceae bacterium]